MLTQAPSVRLALRLVAVLLLLVIAGGTGASPAAANGPVIFDNFIVDYDRMVFNECGAYGAGEYVHVTGQIHIVFFEIETGSGAIYKSQVNPVNVSGVGMTSGVVYRETGMDMGMSTVRDEGGTYTSAGSYHLIGKGKGSNLIVHQIFHVTSNANGETVVFHEFTECR